MFREERGSGILRAYSRTERRKRKQKMENPEQFISRPKELTASSCKCGEDCEIGGMAL